MRRTHPTPTTLANLPLDKRLAVMSRHYSDAILTVKDFLGSSQQEHARSSAVNELGSTFHDLRRIALQDIKERHCVIGAVEFILELLRVLHPEGEAIVGDRRYYTRDVWMKVVIGEGNVGGDHVMIDAPLVVMTRTAADLDDRNEEFVVEAR